MGGFMTKKELGALIMDAIKYGAYFKEEDIQKMQGKSADELAQEVFDGELPFNDLNAQIEINQNRGNYGKEHCGYYVLKKSNELSVIKVDHSRHGIAVFLDKEENGKAPGFLYDGNEGRFQKLLAEGYEKTEQYKEIGTITLRDLEGFSHDEAERVLMDAIASGVIQVRHGQIWPYTYGYELQYGNQSYKPGGNPFSMPKRMVLEMELGKYPSISFKKLETEIQEKRAAQPDCMIPDAETDYFRQKKTKPHWERGHIARYSDLDSGKAMDGIIAGVYGGDYSSMTTGSQNEWMRTAVALRGYCLDYVAATKSFPFRDEVLTYHADRGEDVRTSEGLQMWVRENPGKCAYEENRVVQKRPEKAGIDDLIGKVAGQVGKPQKDTARVHSSNSR